ncbi:MAG: branched-chain amino acid ABC transporter permease [Lachnospiraceae bacterium]|nr:branched-chain amino acid ABC transporter permease [Lachnospiraceae bacterium]
MKRLLHIWAKHEKHINAALLAVAVIYPLIFTRQYLINVGILCLVYVLLSLSLNVLTGYMGITGLGWAGFFGIGAYTAAILSTKAGWNFILTFLTAMVITGMFGLLIGMPTRKLSGRYVAIVTMAFCEICRALETNMDWLTRGSRGIPNIPRLELFGAKFNKQAQYYLILFLVVLAIVVIGRIVNSRVGRGVLAVKDDDIAASAMGVNPFSYKVMTFGVAASLAGLAGAFYAHYIGFIDPSNFTFDQSTIIISMTIMGGLGNPMGSVLGAVTLTILPEILRPLMDVRQIVYGVMLIIMMIVRPQGVLGGFNLKHIRQQASVHKEVRNE